MNLNEAKQNGRDLSETLTTLVAATEGVKESDFAAQQARKDSLEAAIADTKKRMIAESNGAVEKIAKAKADTEAKLAELDNQIKTAQTRLANLQIEVRTAGEVTRAKLGSEKAQLLSENTELKKQLDLQIAQKREQLEEINSAIEEGKRRFA